MFLNWSCERRTDNEIVSITVIYIFMSEYQVKLVLLNIGVINNISKTRLT